jgi:hypothetical protein
MRQSRSVTNLLHHAKPGSYNFSIYTLITLITLNFIERN